ncbi:MAG: hypothetical protein QM742_01670 [Aquabacterium sp.]
MGHTSQYAQGLLNNKTLGTPMMAGELVVKKPDGQFDTIYEAYGSGCTMHVEARLFYQLKAKYGDLGLVPEGSTVIVYCHWSPCRQCVSDTLTTCLALMKVAERQLRVRFRFDTFYTAANWEAYGKSLRPDCGGKFFWKDADEAEAAYTKLASPYGTCPMKNHSTPDSVITSTSPRVAFIAGQARSRTVTSWGAHMRGKIYSNGKLVA